MYLALYRKYRPAAFRDVFSQEHITTTLQNQIKNNQTTHAYLFTGSRGTGKTTCARILAKALNCLSPENGDPCLTCENCLLIDNGSQDISEIDAASNRGIDDARMLREEIRYTPVSLKYRVYIIDEVHMLTTEAFNALLKTLEEPPAHVVFILATTENHKLPLTILSRCQRFEFRRILTSDSVAYLKKVAEKENVKITDGAAELIARLSDGGMRDALSLLETCIAQNSAEINAEVVRSSAGVAGSEHIFGISEAVLTGDVSGALKIINSLHNQSKDMGRLLHELVWHYRNLMLQKLMPDETEMISWLPEETEKYKSFGERYDLRKIMKNLEILEDFTEKIPKRGDKRLSAEMCVVQMIIDGGQAVNEIAVPQRQPEPVINLPPPLEPPPPPPEPPQEVSPWQEILRELPAFLAGMLEDSKVYLSDTVLEITDNTLTGGMVENPVNKAKIKEAVLKITGDDVQVRFINTDGEPYDKVGDFKNLLKEKGIEVRER